MRVVAVALLGLAASGFVAAGPARAQGLGNLGQVLQGTLLGHQDQGRDEDAQRRAYDAGRRDQASQHDEEWRRRNEGGRQVGREDYNRRQDAERRQHDQERQQADRRRADEQHRADQNRADHNNRGEQNRQYPNGFEPSRR